MTQCDLLVSTKWGENGRLVYNYSADGKLWEAGWAVLDMIYNIDPITQNCYVGITECGLGLYGYALNLTPHTLIENVIMSFGDVYDAIRDIVLFMIGDSRGTFNGTYDAGYAIGYSLFLILNPDGY